MPNRPPHPCKPGCPELVPAGTRRCPEHTIAEYRRQDANRGTSTQRGYGVHWQRRRDAWLKAHPLCGDRENGRSAEHSRCVQTGRVTPATVVDHIIPKPLGPDDETNFQSLCKSDHDAKTMKESVNHGR